MTINNNSTPVLPLNERPYRLCIGVIVFNKDNKVFMGERSDLPGQWQFPQGGITIDEIEKDIIGAGLRELEEETGITNVDLIGITKDWVSYDFPTEGHIPNHSEKYRGQRQKWIAVRFNGKDSDINLENHEEIEFSNWAWKELSDAPGMIVPFKRHVYEFVCDAFKYIPSNQKPDHSKIQTLRPKL